MRVLWRLVVLGIGSLAIGILCNQFLNQGIPWRLLIASLPGRSAPGGWNAVPADSAYALFSQHRAVFIDVRSRNDFEMDHIPDAVSLPFFDFFKNPSGWERLDRETQYIIYCFGPTCKEDKIIAKQLSGSGFKRVAVLYGGFGGWLEMEYPIERRNDP